MIVAIVASVFLIVACLLAVGYFQHLREQRRLARVRALSAAHAQILRIEQLEHALPECLRAAVVLQLMMAYLLGKLRGALEIDPRNPYLLKHCERAEQRLASLAEAPPATLPERLKVNGLSQEKATSINTAIGALQALAGATHDEAVFGDQRRSQLRELLAFARVAIPLELLLQQAAMYQTVRNLNTSQKLLRRAADVVASQAGDAAAGLVHYDKVIQERLELIHREILDKQALEHQSAEAAGSERDATANPAEDNPLMAALDRQMANAKSL